MRGARRFGSLVAVLLACAATLSPRLAAAQLIPATPPSPGSVAGAIVTKDGGQAVIGATVTIEGTTRTTFANDGGRFRFDQVMPGTITLRVKAPGFLEIQVPDVVVTSRETTVVGAELQPTPQFLERVQVSGAKTPLAIGDLAAQASVVDRTIMDVRGDQTLTQAIANTTGALVSTQLGIFESVSLRGLPRGDPEFTSTLLLIDGVPQTLSNNGARVIGLTTYDASSIEIVRGPNSALYGRTDIGGSVNMQTADPTINHSLTIDFTGGEMGATKGLVRVSGPLFDWGGYYVSFGKERSSGYFVNKTTNDFVDGDRSVFTKMTFNMGQNTFGSLSVNRVVSDNSTPTNEPIIDGQLLHNSDPRFDRLTNFNIPGRNYQQREGRLTLNLTHQFNKDFKLIGILGYRNVKHMFVEDGDFIGSPFDVDANTVTMYPFSQTTNEDIFYEEVRGEWDPSFWKYKDSLVFGLSHDGNKGSLSQDFIFTDPDTGGWPMNYITPVIPDESLWQHDTGSRTYHLGTTGLFGQYMFEPNARTTITAAGRFDHLRMENTRSAVSTEDTFGAFSPKLSAVYKLLPPSQPDKPTLNVYGAYSHAFLPPRRPSSLVPADADLNLEPENINNYEGGIKGTALENRLSYDASYFFMTENGVVLTNRQGPYFLPTNSGELRYRGFEGSAEVRITPKVSVFGNTGFYHNRYGDFVIQDETDPTLDEDITGNRLPIAPDYILNFGTHFRPTPTTQGTFEVKNVGGVETNRENTFSLDSYTLVDAAFTYDYKQVRFTISAHNLFNSEYYGNSDGETADPGQPRQFLFTTSVRVK